MSNLVPTQIQKLRCEAERLQFKLARLQAEIEAQEICAGLEQEQEGSSSAHLWEEWPYGAARALWARAVQSTSRRFARREPVQENADNPSGGLNGTCAAIAANSHVLVAGPDAAVATPRGNSLEHAVRLGAQRVSGLHCSVITPASGRPNISVGAIARIPAPTASERESGFTGLRLV